MMFPYSAEVDTGLSSMNPPLEENLVSQESWVGEGAPSYAEMGASLPLNVANFLSQVGVRLTYHGGKTLRNSIGVFHLKLNYFPPHIRHIFWYSNYDLIMNLGTYMSVYAFSL